MELSSRPPFNSLQIVFLLLVLSLASSCGPGAPPEPTNPPVVTDISRGGRTIAVTINAADKQVAIAASESGGLFRTIDGGTTWQHIDTFPAIPMVDVAFAEPSSTDSQVVIATTLKDGQLSATANNGGIWRSTDAGLTWTHILAATVLTATGHCAAPQSAYGIAFSGANSIYVGADCGLLYSSDLGSTWINLFSLDSIYSQDLVDSVRSVIAQPLGNSTLIDVCLEFGHSRSTDGGITWSPIHEGPNCETPHGIAISPLETNVLFATAVLVSPEGYPPNTPLFQSDDGGETWDTHLQATSYTDNERPVWVKTRAANDGSTTHFDLYFAGYRVTCSTTSPGPRCPSNPGETWVRFPDSSAIHDINDIAFDPNGNCPLLMATDYGIYKAGSATPTSPCGEDNAWTQVAWTHPETASPSPGPIKVEVPDVQDMHQAPAEQAIIAVGLVPAHPPTDPTGPGAWVWSQSPKAGTLVGTGSTVHLRLRTGPIP